MITAVCSELAGALLLKLLPQRWGSGTHPFSQSPAFSKLLVICVCQSVTAVGPSRTTAVRRQVA